jgi:hypothetical protein
VDSQDQSILVVDGDRRVKELKNSDRLQVPTFWGYQWNELTVDG